MTVSFALLMSHLLNYGWPVANGSGTDKILILPILSLLIDSFATRVGKSVRDSLTLMIFWWAVLLPSPPVTIKKSVESYV
jgi:hypothetical protein